MALACRAVAIAAHKPGQVQRTLMTRLCARVRFLQGMSLPACFSSSTADNTQVASRSATAAAVAEEIATGLTALQLPGVLMQLTCLTSLQLTLTAGEAAEQDKQPAAGCTCSRRGLGAACMVHSNIQNKQGHTCRKGSGFCLHGARALGGQHPRRPWVYAEHAHTADCC